MGSIFGLDQRLWSLVFSPKCDSYCFKFQRTFIRNTQILLCCFNLRGLRLLLWHKKISWQQIYKEQNKMLLFILENSFQKNYDNIREIKNTPFFNSKCCFNHSCFESVLASLAAFEYISWVFLVRQLIFYWFLIKWFDS
jgi:hypothetical protein